MQLSSSPRSLGCGRRQGLRPVHQRGLLPAPRAAAPPASFARDIADVDREEPRRRWLRKDGQSRNQTPNDGEKRTETGAQADGDASTKRAGQPHRPSYASRGSRPGQATGAMQRGSRGLSRRARGLEVEDPDASAAGSTDTTTAQGERPSRPPRAPIVRHRMDLPVVRPGDEDKGTFYAPRARFEDLGLTRDVVDALRTLGFRRPSHVQAATLELWRDRDAKHIAIADQAGSGKTLAYLLPLFHALRAQDSAAGSPQTTPNCPRAVVLAPTTELVQQVFRVAKALSGAGARLRVAAMTGGQADERERQRTARTQRGQLGDGVDLVIATPGRALEHLKNGALRLDRCTAVVLDEVDVLLGARGPLGRPEGKAGVLTAADVVDARFAATAVVGSDAARFEEQVSPLRQAAPPGLRFVLVTATLPQHTAEQLRISFRGLALASGPGLHRTAPGLVEELVDCSGGDEVSLETGTARKLEGLDQVLRAHAAPRTLIFCNKIEACRVVENALRRKHNPEELQVLVYHEAVREDLRQAAMNAFLSPVGQEGEALAYLGAQSGRRGGRSSGEVDGPGDVDNATAVTAGEAPAPQPPLKQAGKPPRLVLVATDRMSRGIDCMYCQHVVLFDFPRDPSEYVRRVGRTARGAGGTGVVSCLVLGRQVALARDVMGRNEKGQPVHRLPQL